VLAVFLFFLNSHWSPPTMVHTLPMPRTPICNPLRNDNNNDSNHRCTPESNKLLSFGTAVSSLDRSTKNVSSNKLTLSTFCCIQFRPYHYHTNYARQPHKLFNHPIYLYPMLFCIHIFPISKWCYLTVQLLDFDIIAWLAGRAAAPNFASMIELIIRGSS
jgi:hypothetical protein